MTVAVPLPPTEEGVKLHLLSTGRPEHDALEKLIVLLYPGCPVMVRVVVPLDPGRVTETVESEAAKAKSASTLIAMDAVDEPW